MPEQGDRSEEGRDGEKSEWRRVGRGGGNEIEVGSEGERSGLAGERKGATGGKYSERGKERERGKEGREEGKLGKGTKRWRLQG